MILEAQRPLIQRALWLDGVVSLLAGLACLPVLGWLAVQFGVPSSAVMAVAAFMAGYGLWLLLLAQGIRQPAPWLWGIVIGNALWVAASVALAFSGWIAPSTVGIVLLLGQAAVVLVLTELQFFGMRRRGEAQPA